MLSVVSYKPFSLRVLKDFGIIPVCFEVVSEFRRVPFCHSEVVHEVMTAVYWSGAGNLLSVVDRSEGSQQQFINLTGRAAALENEVKACQSR